MNAVGGFLDPSTITDPIKNHTQERPYVYFEDLAVGLIKIGYVGNYREGLKARAKYNRDGARLLAVIPGRDIEERELHYAFDDERDRARGRERFRPSERLLSYIHRLLQRGFAAPSYDAVQYVPAVAFDVWKPGSPSLGNAVDATEQISIFDVLPIRERIAIEGNHFSAQSKTDDWYTPKRWVDLAREVMGGIDLDPATTQQANDQAVLARFWYSKETNGLDITRPWHGRVWLNPPYGTGPNSQKMFVARLHREVCLGNVREAVTCLNINVMCSKWFLADLAPIATAHCVPRGRLEFIPPAGVSRSMGSQINATLFSYVGPNVDRFNEVYAPHGYVIVPSKLKPEGEPLPLLAEAAE